ncbi:hypothetical protein CVT24_010959 [Panaeolus cyanescens]|uniref:CxC2-like cysteine cluster KDZ transposase-associated domain-containing protein n=1 Tax=Panaeolus cyanescens TaxID=181874 RepID=A0A409YYH4_9AGAR|nr:hypothetical protein CVT24_010959 [Panaeolus cyanescens]
MDTDNSQNKKKTTRRKRPKKNNILEEADTEDIQGEAHGYEEVFDGNEIQQLKYSIPLTPHHNNHSTKASTSNQQPKNTSINPTALHRPPNLDQSQYFRDTTDTANADISANETGYQPADASTFLSTKRQKAKTKAPSKTQRDYIQEFASQIDSLLAASLSRETIRPEHKLCQGCNNQRIAIWRCKDCFFSDPICRSCMRQQHLKNPFHRIERWTGSHFEPDWLSNVGVYLLLEHRSDNSRPARCSELDKIALTMEGYDAEADKREQELLLTRQMPKIYPPSSFAAHMTASMAAETIPTLEEEIEATKVLDAIIQDALLGKDLEEAEQEVLEVDEEEELAPSDSDLNFFANYSSLPNLYGDTSTLKSHPKSDAIRIVHTNGIHMLHLMTCTCSSDKKSVVLDLVASRLMPASFTKIQTVFSIPLLEQARICNLELKSSAYQFYAMICRITEPIAPHLVPNLYHEFRRMMRIWRWMKKLRWAGFGHRGDAQKATDGEIANFCSTCPQPGINLPPDWESDADNPIYRRSFVADGNFKADHIKQKTKDVPLYDGAGMMPNSEHYQQFLENAEERLTKAPCENSFKAVITAMIASKSCDRTGVVGIACARHGCYCPNGLVDLFKGEQQKNVDYAFLRSLETTYVHPKQQVMLLYDIACQYSVHFQDRVGHLLKPGQVIDTAIGLFHVHAHKDQCYFRFSPSFIPGSGILIGEILESLWSALNEISQTARTATLSHRAEMIDDHSSDSNHRKALRMGMTLCVSYGHAKQQAATHQKYFEGLSSQISPDLLLTWTQEIEFAESNRLSNRSLMDIYKANVSPPEPRPSASSISNSSAADSNTLVQQCFEFAIFVEEKQLEIQHQSIRSQASLTQDQAQALEEQRGQLIGLIAQLRGLEAKAKLHSVTITGEPIEFSEGTQWDDEELVGLSLPAASWNKDSSLAEFQPLSLPSSRNVDSSLAPIELQLRIRQATTQLNKIRDLIAEKSMQFSHVQRNAPTTAIKTRSRQKVKNITAELKLHSRIYSRCRERLTYLDAPTDIMDQFQHLSPADIHGSTAILDPNTPGSTSLKLSWIWHTLQPSTSDTDSRTNAVNECMYTLAFIYTMVYSLLMF